MLRMLIVAVLSALTATGTAFAADVAGSRDHELVGRYDGSEIVGYRLVDYDEASLIVGPIDPVKADTRTGPGFQTVEGRSTLIYYRLPEGRSSLEVQRNYEASLKAKGFAILFACATSDGTCFESKAPDAAYYLGHAIGDPLTLPRLGDDYVHNWFEQKGRYLLARIQRPTGAVYAAIAFGESSRGTVAVVRVIESKEMDANKIVFLDAGQMGQALAQDGKVNLYGIFFDFDKDAVKPESKPTLDEIGKLMGGNPQLKLSVVGHTDNRGSADYNMDLSRRRAASVVAALTSGYSIESSRLASSGAGLTQPVADNATEEGRAKNRRVELVAQ